jgi:hypothetical protein
MPVLEALAANMINPQETTMAGVLNFSNYIGGPDNVQIEQIFPSTQRTMVYNFGQNITDWTFNLDAQTIVVDTMTFDRNTGEPNFASSTVIGVFTTTQITTSTNVNVINASSGTVAITFPGGLYSGPVLPDARKNVPITVVGVTWATDDARSQINTHRWAFIQSYEPGVRPGDPALSVSPQFYPITVSA